ncbi:uncharacterized protein LOC111286169 [Durio zibethinus]|uniref:Uncharacterized protein LOC111286169 n=1 Tax=Durio zibethinus TaxID=66656 RepID=A0A6P5XUQ8_DURZI|nr:uncharacterized protein LOC111286169 [Durio zibethinus]
MSSRCRNPNPRARSPPPRSRPRDPLPCSKRAEPERLPILEKRQQCNKSNHEDDDRELCMKKLSEFNESLLRQGQSTSTKFQWSHLLLDNSGEASAEATKPELAMQNVRTAATYSISPMGICITKENRFIDSREPQLKEIKLGFDNNGEGFRYPDVRNRGTIAEAVDFVGRGEILGFESSCMISEMARNRIMRTEQATELAYRKMESTRARASAICSIIDKIDGAVESWALEQYMAEQNIELLHGERHQQREDCSHYALTQRYMGFSGQGNEVVGFTMNRPQTPKGGPFRGELGSGHVCPQLYPDLEEKSRRFKGREVLGCWMNHDQSQNEAVFLGESQQFQHYVNLSGRSHEVEQQNVGFSSRINCRHSPKRAPVRGEMQELPQDYGHYLPSNYLDISREPHVKEQTDDVSSSLINDAQAEKGAVLNDERQDLSEDYSHSLPQLDLDFCVESHETQQENVLLDSMMNGPHKRRGALLHGEEQQMQQDCSHSLFQYHLGLKEESHVMEQEIEALASRMNHLQDQKVAFFHGETLPLQQDCALESYPLSKQDDDVRTAEGSTQQISATEELGINGQFSKARPRKRIIDLRKIRESQISTLTRTLDASNDEILDAGYRGEQSSDDDFQQLLLLRNSGSEPSQDEGAVLFDELPDQRNIIDCDYQFSTRHMREFSQPSNRKNIKQRLGSSRKSIKQRLGPPCQVHSNRKSIKQRLGRPCQVYNPNVMPPIERHKTRKLLMKNVNDVHKGVQARDVDLPVVKRGRTEPPEDTEEFKQLIDAAFVKFVKVLNENPAQRRKYTEKGAAETLKCCVCGSNSKDFVNTPSLLMHAFTSRMVGRRVDHLGLHKALCLLMGWSSMAASNSLWVQKTLPDAEALAMTEDLVVWPPVVILHNSSIAATNLDDQIIVSIEELEAFLRDMGFGRGISKVCRGKPANQSIMTVIFHGTFSGLQEAERLHNLYAENKHGRAEFRRMKCSSGETQKVSLDKFKDVLYGYLGIAVDLDKLDFETKSRSVVKSKKEIYAIADALLYSE